MDIQLTTYKKLPALELPSLKSAVNSMETPFDYLCLAKEKFDAATGSCLKAFTQKIKQIYQKVENATPVEAFHGLSVALSVICYMHEVNDMNWKFTLNDFDLTPKRLFYIETALLAINLCGCLVNTPEYVKDKGEFSEKDYMHMSKGFLHLLVNAGSSYLGYPSLKLAFAATELIPTKRDSSTSLSDENQKV